MTLEFDVPAMNISSTMTKLRLVIATKAHASSRGLPPRSRMSSITFLGSPADGSPRPKRCNRSTQCLCSPVR